MFRKQWILAVASAATILMTGASLQAGTFGTVVPIGGEAADIALDPTRGVLYIANFTANRIDVMTLSNNTIQTSINVPAQPNSLSVSPDGHWLLVANYGNNSAPASSTNALTLIDLTNSNAKQTFTLSNSPLSVSFGLDNKALVVTTQEFIIFDPVVGTTTLIRTIAQAATQAIPQPPQSFPANFTQASAAVSGDGLTIAGIGGGTTSGILEYRYNVATHGLSAVSYTASPAAGPRVVSLSKDGTLSTFAWTVQDTNLNVTAQFANPSGLLQIGSSLIDSSRNLIYAQIPISGTSATVNTSAPILNIVDSDNLTLRDQISLAENLAGKSILSADNNTMYSISDSGVMILPVGSLGAFSRLSSSVEDLVFRGNFCNRNIATQTFMINDPGGNRTPFSISTTTAGITISPSSGVTPATVTVSVDPNAFASQKGTVTAYLNISSSAAINLPPSIRVLINSQDPAQRGSFIDVPGTVVDLLADPKRNVYYVLRQDKNQVLVYNGSNNTLAATLRTCTTPKGMTITFDQQNLLVGCDNAHYISVFDLDLLTAQQPIYVADYVQSISASANAILAHVRPIVAKTPGLARVDMIARVATQLPTLGVYQNTLPLDTVLTASSNGAHILIASSDGSVMVYDANADSFTASRKDFAALGGAYAASNFGQYVVGTNLLDSSLVPRAKILTNAANSSGFAFMNTSGYYTAATSVTSPGIIQQINLTTGNAIQPTPTVEAPLLGTTSSSTTNATSTTPLSPTAASSTSVFTRSLAPLPTQTSIIALSTSGFTVLPWNYAASVAPPQISAVVSAADSKSPAAPGGLITVYGSQLSPTNQATAQIPVPTALANSCITVNGQPIPLIFVSPSQVNAQMPFQAVGAETIVVHTPAGTSDNFNITVQPNAPAVFLSGVAGPANNLPTIIRYDNGLLATDSNPIHRNDTLVIYVTGLGQTNPAGLTGYPAPGDPPANALTPTTVSIGGVNLAVSYAGLAPGEVGVYQINAVVPGNAPVGLGMPLTITQGSGTVSVPMRVIP
jgi:uncharacterized protein (TIGR03437 family)